MDSERLRRMADYYRAKRRFARAAEAYAELGEHLEAATHFALQGDELRKNRNYEGALECYLSGAFQFRQARELAGARDMNECARDCETHLRDVDRNAALYDQAKATRESGRTQAEAWVHAATLGADQSRASFALLADTLREGFLASSRALVQGLTTLAEGQRAAAIAGAEIMFKGLEQLAVSQSRGLEELSGAVREGDVLKAISTWASLRGLSRADAGSVDALKNAIAESTGRLSAGQRESAAVHVVRLLDVMAKAVPSESAAPPQVIRHVVSQGTDSGGFARAQEPLPQVSHGQCHLGSKGPPEYVMTIVRHDGIYQLCNVANAAHSRSWHGVHMLAAKRLEQGTCPLPNSRGILQRFLWLETCRLADGSEHRLD